jgi:flagellar hook-associated protein 1
MSGLFGSLNQTVGALSAHSRGIETAGRNLSNVNNPDYARQRVVFGDRGTVLTPLGAMSLGLQAKSIQQIRDTLLDSQVVREVSLTSSAKAGMNALAKAQAALGETIDRTSTTDGSRTSNGLDVAISNFFNGFQALASQPTDLGTRQTLLQHASLLVDRFRLTDQRLAQVQTDLTTEATADVGEINNLLSAIAELNGQIGRFEVNAQGSAVDLRDQRQAKLEALAAKMNIETAPSAGAPGQIDVFARDGNGDPVSLVSLATAGSVTFDGTTMSAGGTAIALTGGSVHGSITARDDTLQTLRDRLDDLAQQVVTSVNAAYNPGGSTGDFFVAGGVTASTIALQPGLTATSLKASDGGAAGDNSIAAAVAALATTRFAIADGDVIDGSFAQYYSGVVSDFGQAVSGAKSRYEDQATIETLVRQQRDSVSGVSLDEEMADLLKFQRAFQASSRVFTVIDSLLDNIVNRLGV